MADSPRTETPAQAFDRYLAEAERRQPVRKPPKRWDRSTIILAIVEVGIVLAGLAWWLAGVADWR
ncbi:hypothetical protein HCU64_20795 [Methylobacterium sp. C25]|uniref:hypothetical protein n=1 Tax=Methylobacterium sp. C25 TaxID=2721622 RepID=UPI001F218806|nr:hypothetical protein [Methylobacterium sp. C25]MCE4226192.1 hypothetical protein [Methylobacterium sp. C25]